MDKLLSTAQVAEALGCIHQNDVRRLIQQGKLAAKTMVVRGTGKRPRLYVAESEVERFIRELPAPEKPITEFSDDRPKRPRTPSWLMKEIRNAKQYY